MTKASFDEDVLKKLLKERVEAYFKMPWERICKLFADVDTLTENYVSFDTGSGICLFWEIKAIEPEV